MVVPFLSALPMIVLSLFYGYLSGECILHNVELLFSRILKCCFYRYKMKNNSFSILAVQVEIIPGSSLLL